MGIHVLSGGRMAGNARSYSCTIQSKCVCCFINVNVTIGGSFEHECEPFGWAG